MTIRQPSNQTTPIPSEEKREPIRRPVILILALVSAMGSLATHIIAPVLPIVQDDLTTNVPQVQLVISVYLAGLGFGQLVCGPIVDRWGRMPVLYLGIALYAAGALASALSPTWQLLVVSRAIQAIGGAAGLISSRTLVADIFGRSGGARHQATLLAAVLLSPALGPIVGAYLAGFGSWRLVPLFLALIALVAFVLVQMNLRPLARQYRPSRARELGLLRGLARLARNRRFAMNTAAMSFSSSTIYIFISYAPFVLEREFGLGERATGFGFLAIAVAGIFGTRLVHHIERRANALIVGCAISLAGICTMLVLALSGVIGPVALIACMAIGGVGGSISAPAAINYAVRAEPNLAGTGASLTGATQMIFCALATVPLGLLNNVSSLALAAAICLMAILAFGAAILSRQSR